MERFYLIIIFNKANFSAIFVGFISIFLCLLIDLSMEVIVIPDFFVSFLFSILLVFIVAGACVYLPQTIDCDEAKSIMYICVIVVYR